MLDPGLSSFSRYLRVDDKRINRVTDACERQELASTRAVQYNLAGDNERAPQATEFVQPYVAE